jgi:hypothetical protein
MCPKEEGAATAVQLHSLPVSSPLRHGTWSAESSDGAPGRTTAGPISTAAEDMMRKGRGEDYKDDDCMPVERRLGDDDDDNVTSVVDT